MNVNNNLISSPFFIRALEDSDVSMVTYWARNEGFAPGLGDVAIYKNTENQGLWVGTIDHLPIGCIAGVKYNSLYGFIGLFIVDKAYRGNGYGVKLWSHVINNLDEVRCLGIEAAPDRITDYKKWGFKVSSKTTRWKLDVNDSFFKVDDFNNLMNKYSLLEGNQIPKNIIQNYDENKEYTPRPHFLSDWLSHKSGTVLAIVNKKGLCVGFSRIRPCLFRHGNGYRIGPLIADSPILASYLIKSLVMRFPGFTLIDTPGLNVEASKLMESLGFNPISHTVRMYKGKQPTITMSEVYGLACLELG